MPLEKARLDFIGGTITPPNGLVVAVVKIIQDNINFIKIFLIYAWRLLLSLFDVVSIANLFKMSSFK